MQGIQVSVHQIGARRDVSLLAVSGTIDTTTCQEMAKTIHELLKQKKVLMIVDLGRVTYISSAGWGVFVGEIKNVREQGGDLKIVQMAPEVYEVFEMLEFNKILNTYESVEEAVDEFDIVRGIDITQFDKDSVASLVPSPAGQPPIPIHLQQKRASTEASDAPVSFANLPLVERIKRVVIENPKAGFFTIRRKLRSEKYGNARVGPFRLYAILREQSLETTEKRLRFYRSR
jgi:anti-sigma B factor antagonist